MADGDLEKRVAALERENDRIRRQVSELGFLLHAFMLAVSTDLASHADGISPEAWARDFIGDLHHAVDHEDERPPRPDWVPFGTVSEQVRAQIDWLQGLLAQAARWM
jgi:hypothetical protein